MKNKCIIFYLVVLSVLLCGVGGSFSAESIDIIVLAQQNKTGFKSSHQCSDEVFLRRVYLDAIGTIPTADESHIFLKTQGHARRDNLINDLLERDEFAIYMGLKWCDLLRVKAEFPSNLWPNAVQAYHRWIVDAFRNEMPYDQFVHALLTTSGSNFRDAPVNFYRPFQKRTPRNIFNTVALIFMGMRLENSNLSEEELLGMDAFFAKVAYKKTAEWKEEIIYFDPLMKFVDPKTKKPIIPTPLNGKPLKLGELDDPRIVFADWLTSPKNPWFAKAIVNRIWYQLMGRGIVHPADDIRPDNPAWSDELLDFLAKELVKNEYNLKHIYRIILNSDTYQCSSLPMYGNASDERGFSHYRLRRMDAEVLIDAICQITGTHEKYSSAIPEPFTFIPQNQRSIMLADGSIKSSFLEMFGRPGRDTSYISDRNNDVSVFQSLHMLNSSHIQNKIMQGPRLKKLFKSKIDLKKKIDELYLSILSRYPTDEERQIVVEYRKTSKMKPYDVAYDLAWSLINSKEFMLQH